ncbi:hypothetical protein CLU92_3785 [Janthinobacterium sp. 61]|uniref:hypothetical protein n=1 Tax=Janthinobacterium sp. 61 TaxID=2035209 RepID=UPI000C70BC04|nr:hypothetical protein [Janthinobacterium sp. 61]PKV46378.1 hypothetical protein CLU92_3785 [Janthinobacterium sp. 61]
MSERKYRFHRPNNPDQHLEAIYEELSLSPHEHDRRPTQTLKDHVVALLKHAREIESKRESKDLDRSYSINWALGALAFLACLFLWHGLTKADDTDWLYQHHFAIRLWGIAFAAVFLGVSIERSSFFKSLWLFGFTKIVASIALSSLIIFSTGKASSLINAVFPVDASALPLTRAIVAGLLAFQYLTPLLGVVALFAVFHALNAAGWITAKWSRKNTYESPPFQSVAFLLLSIVVLLFTTRWVNDDFSEVAWPAKIYRLAHALDFNSKYECKNLRKGLSVVFLGPDQARVLVDTRAAKTDDLESFVDQKLSSQIEVTKQFYVLPCDLGEH